MSEFTENIRSAIRREGRASDELIAKIDDELRRQPSVELWILRGDAIQLTDTGSYDLEDAASSYERAIQMDRTCAEAYESLAYFALAVKDDAAGSLELFRRAIALGGGDSAREGLRQAEDELGMSTD